MFTDEEAAIIVDHFIPAHTRVLPSLSDTLIMPKLSEQNFEFEPMRFDPARGEWLDVNRPVEFQPWQPNIFEKISLKFGQLMYKIGL